jgi:hypothetical protein
MVLLQIILMIMKKILLIASIFMSANACKENNVEQDMDAYCECINLNSEVSEVKKPCDSLMQDIIQKYEYEPEALPIIIEKTQKCK